MTTDLSGWLLEQIAEDEQVARASQGDPARPGAGVWTRQCSHLDEDFEPEKPGHDNCCVVAGDITIYDEGGHGPEDADHIARWDPARVLAECEVKRRLVKMHADDQEHYCPSEDAGSEYYNYMNGWAEEKDNLQICPTLKLLALPYADRPGYREEWKP